MLGADRPPRHQQPLPLGSDDRIRMNHSQIHPGHPAWIRLLSRRVDPHWDLGGHVDEQAAIFAEQSDRPNLLDRVTHIAR